MKFKISKHKFIPNESPSASLYDLMITLRWDYNAHTYLNQYTQRDWIQTLHTKFNECANWIHNNTEADLFDVNTITSCLPGMMLFEEMPMFSFDPSNYGQNGYMGILGGRYVVNMDRNIDENFIYIGTQDHPKIARIFIDNLTRI